LCNLRKILEIVRPRSWNQFYDGEMNAPGLRSQMNRNRKNKNKGFTLVEIMIVVLIIGILLAIALPNFIRARASSRYRAILANLQQVNAAKEQWAMDQGQATGAACSIVTNLVPGYIPIAPNGPIAGVGGDANGYAANAVDTAPTFNGNTSATWTTNCQADPTVAACGL